MTERKLRYVERKRLAETGSLGDLVHDAVPQTFRNALWYLVFEPSSRGRDRMLRELELECRHYFGWGSERDTSKFIMSAPPDDLLSFIEIFLKYATRHWNNTPYGTPPSSSGWLRPLPDGEQHLNFLFERHRFGYRIENGEIHKIGSPLLEKDVVRPALLAVSAPGWDQVEKSYREALDHQRGRETDDALTAAHAAVEAALKASGMTGKFGAMVKQFRTSPFVPPYLRSVPAALDSLLTLLARSNAIRSTEGDAHGKAPGASEVPQALADLAIHWAGAFIVYLASAGRAAP